MKGAIALLALLATCLSSAVADEGVEPERVPLVPGGVDHSVNPGFEEGTDDAGPADWTIHAPADGTHVRWGDHGIGGSKGLRFEARPGTGEGVASRGSASQRIDGLPDAGDLDLTVWVRLTSFDGFFLVWARCDGADGVERREGAYTNSQLVGYDPQGSTIWSPVTVRLRLAPTTRRVAWGLLVSGRGTVEVDEARAVVREERSASFPPGADGPGLYRAEGRYTVRVRKDAESMRVQLPVPILWRDQVPLDFVCVTEPPAHLGSVRLLRRPHGFHVAEVELRDLRADTTFEFSWDANVLALPHEATPVPEGVALPLSDVPDDVRPWTASTWCCGADDEAIRAVAAEILAGGATADVAIPATLARMREIFRAADGHVDALTAEQALTKRGSCTSCANLGAALLRAEGIPARVIAGYPTWSGPLQTHYVVEYWLPVGGWRLMESTRCLDDRPSWEQIEVAMVLPQDEAQERAGARQGAAPGVPWLSLTEYPDSEASGDAPAWLVGATERAACDHQAVTVARFRADDAAWAQAKARLSARWRTLTAAAVADEAAVAGLAPPPASDVDSLHDLMEAYLGD